MSTVFLQRQEDITISTSSVEIRDISIVVPDCLLIFNFSHAIVQLIDTGDGRVLSEVSMAYWINKPPMWRLCLAANDRAAHRFKQDTDDQHSKTIPQPGHSAEIEQ